MVSCESELSVERGSMHLRLRLHLAWRFLRCARRRCACCGIDCLESEEACSSLVAVGVREMRSCMVGCRERTVGVGSSAMI